MKKILLLFLFISSVFSQTQLNFTNRNFLIEENPGKYSFQIEITNPSSSNSTSFDIVLVRGDATVLNNFQTISPTIPAGSSTKIMFSVEVTGDEKPEQLQYFTFEIQNVTGGDNAVVGDVNQFTLTIVDNDWDKHFMYDGIDNFVGDELKKELYYLSRGHTEFPYTSSETDTWDIIEESDQDPLDTTKVSLIYSGIKLDKKLHSFSDFNKEQWNREHVWAKSHGDFGTSTGTGTDVHNLRACYHTVNTDRSNLDFDEGGVPHTVAIGCKSDSDSWEPRDEVKGDVARIIFYMAMRYEGENGEPDLQVVMGVDTSPNKEPFHGNKDILLSWNKIDPPDAFERRRNEIIYKYQFNRNPFVDNPNYVDKIWGPVDAVEKTEDIPKDFFLAQNYPNPFNPSTKIKFGLAEESSVIIEVYNILGEEIKTLVNEELSPGTFTTNFDADDLPAGIYFYTIRTEKFIETKKMILMK